ncbi:unknown [Clostridium sp. CAG:273]|nr:unknown [Clostridium sp. CAG:273]
MKGLTDETSTGRTSFQNASGQGNWNIHPAFNYGQTVSGLWVAKFEASNSSGKIKVEPGVSSWRYNHIGSMYTNCINYNSVLNSHMMKNDEWGAVAYLSKSKYGKNAEVTINGNSSYYTGGGSGNAYITNVGQSTTGTVYGVYDMNGGTKEYVAAYVNNGDKALNQYGQSLVNGDNKTKNVYEIGTPDGEYENYIANSRKYGDAVYETSANVNDNNSSWYGDYSSFPCRSWTFFYRGGNYNHNTSAGMFYFSEISYGVDTDNVSFRPVLIAL